VAGVAKYESVDREGSKQGWGLSKKNPRHLLEVSLDLPTPSRSLWGKTMGRCFEGTLGEGVNKTAVLTFRQDRGPHGPHMSPGRHRGPRS
jgi:hypothetical protein